jgi:pimeloyl-ACP methyl ester carboxylesterase
MLNHLSTWQNIFLYFLAITAMILSGCNLQRKMLYYPSSFVPAREELSAGHIQFWPSGRPGYRGFIGTSQIKNSRGTVIIFHGNAGTAAGRSYYVRALESLGYRVLLAEYPGYGARTGELGEKSFVNDAKETVRLIHEQFGDPIFLLGESLGAGVAAAVVKNMPGRIHGIVLITPWDTLLAVAESKFPWWFPVRLFMRDEYDTIANLRDYPGRIAVVGAENDEIIPINRANALYGSLPGIKEMWLIKGTGHNNWLSGIDQSWWQTVMGFISGNRNDRPGQIK